MNCSWKTSFSGPKSSQESLDNLICEVNQQQHLACSNNFIGSVTFLETMRNQLKSKPKQLHDYF